jgi:hypothetical protein
MPTTHPVTSPCRHCSTWDWCCRQGCVAWCEESARGLAEAMEMPQNTSEEEFLKVLAATIAHRHGIPLEEAQAEVQRMAIESKSAL